MASITLVGDGLREGRRHPPRARFIQASLDVEVVLVLVVL
jgi:hypothetical protein